MEHVGTGYMDGKDGSVNGLQFLSVHNVLLRIQIKTIYLQMQCNTCTHTHHVELYKVSFYRKKFSTTTSILYDPPIIHKTLNSCSLRVTMCIKREQVYSSLPIVS